MDKNIDSLITYLALNSGSSGGSSEVYEFEDFSRFCYGGARLDYIEKYGTSKGTNFYEMFTNCNSLVTIPKIDTSNGTNFCRMFYYCTSITEIPKLDTHNGTNFGAMFTNCKSLVTIPKIDTSNGTNFSSMFYYCNKLSSVPLINTHNGTNFESMFSNCNSLASIPELDTSNGTNFKNMFSVSGLETLPYLNLSKAQTLAGMFKNCSSLTQVGELDTSNVTEFVEMFSYCKKLVTVSKLDLNKVNSSGLVSNIVQYASELVTLNLYNVRVSITIGSGSSYGHKLSVDCLVHIIQQLCTAVSKQTLTIGSVNLNKLVTVWCKVIDDTDEKKPMELCEINDEGAMLIREYAQLKNWSIK